VFTALILVCTLASAGLGLLDGGWAGAWVRLGLLGGEILYLVTGLLLARAPARVWLALVYAPVFLVWKVGLYLRALVGRKQRTWQRTER
jgi:hypothetical protein